MWLLLSVIAAHWLADFVLQTHWQAVNKSKDNSALFAHVTTYALTMTFVLAFLLIIFNATSSFVGWIFITLMFGIVTFATHFATDYVTSRITSKLYAKGDYHNFFVVIGFDQLIHYTTLFVTLYALEVVS